MRDSVRSFFTDFSANHEGFTPFMYCDSLNLVTTGIGNLIDAGPNHPGASSVERARLNNVVSAAAMLPAMKLPWRLRGPGWTSKNPVAGELVSPAEVADAWTRVKRQNEVVPDFSQRGGGKYASLTNLTLDKDALMALFNNTLTSFDNALRKHYQGYDTWPADAQLAIMSMSWAMGPAFHPALGFQAFKNAADIRDFATMAVQSTFKGGGSITDKASRNAENFLMFNNAAVVERAGGDPDRLIFPGTGSGIGAGAGAGNVASADGNTKNIVVGTGAAILGGWGLWQLWKAGRKS